MTKHQTQCGRFAIIILILYITASEAAKLSARPVHETSNEQARIDEKRSLNLGTIPYGNPLAGNSKQNAKLHAQNQQAMFNAERIRQHRAQLQRWTKAPPKMDSYMKAYQESQESHHLALEQQQTRSKEKFVSSTTPQTPRQDTAKASNLLNAEPLKITKADAIIRPEINRSHRSFGSLEYQYLQPKKLQNVFLTAGPTYDQGVTIKSNANVGVANLKTTPETKVFTDAIPSSAKYSFTPQNFESYASVQDISALNSLLTKSPYEQVTNFNSLLDPSNSHPDLNTPIDLQFYLKNFPQQNEQVKYVDLPLTYANAYVPEKPKVKDFVPITEEVDDIANPNEVRIKPIKPNQAKPQSIDMETTTTKSNNYYKVEVASQTIRSGYKNPQNLKTYFKPEKPIYQYAYKPVSYLLEREKPEVESEKKYQHLNFDFKGVQHLNEDGTGVSAYGDDNLHYAANYEFGYRVQDHKTGNDFGHHEAKHGGKTNGQYHVLLPDGRMQNVKYSAGPEGFHADISYDHLQYKYT